MYKRDNTGGEKLRKTERKKKELKQNYVFLEYCYSFVGTRYVTIQETTLNVSEVCIMLLALMNMPWKVCLKGMFFSVDIFSIIL